MRYLIALVLVLSSCLSAPPPESLSPKVNEAIARLGHWAPPSGYIRVRIEPMRDRSWLGYAYKTPFGWEIVLDSEQPDQVIIDTLVHEWAHALRDHAGSKYSRSHDAYWGAAVSEAYLAVITPVPK